MHVAKAAAERALLSTIPDHVMRELEQHAAEAKAEAEKLKVGRVPAGNASNSIPCTLCPLALHQRHRPCCMCRTVSVVTLNMVFSVGASWTFGCNCAAGECEGGGEGEEAAQATPHHLRQRSRWPSWSPVQPGYLPVDICFDLTAQYRVAGNCPGTLLCNQRKAMLRGASWPASAIPTVLQGQILTTCVHVQGGGCCHRRATRRGR